MPKFKNQLMLGDMTTISSSISDNSIDLILTDPPYNISKQTNFHKWDKNTVHNMQFDQTSKNSWDSLDNDQFKLMIKSWVEIWYKKLRPRGHFIIFCADRFITPLWEELEDIGLEPKRLVTWKKQNAVPVNRKSTIISACEFLIYGIKPGSGKKTFKSDLKNLTDLDNSIIYSENVAEKISSIVHKHARHAFLTQNPNINIEFIIENILKQSKNELVDIVSEITNTQKVVIPNSITCPSASNRIHPTEKPVRLLKYFISLLTNEHDIILDTFSGSGSTGQAAAELNRQFILIEQEDLFFNASKKRLEKFL